MAGPAELVLLLLHLHILMALPVILPNGGGATPVREDAPPFAAVVANASSPEDTMSVTPSDDLVTTGAEPEPDRLGVGTGPSEPEVLVTTLEPVPVPVTTPASEPELEPKEQDLMRNDSSTVQEQIRDLGLVQDLISTMETGSSGSGRIKQGRQIGYTYPEPLPQQSVCGDAHQMKNTRIALNDTDEDIVKHIYVHLPAPEPTPLPPTTRAPTVRRRKHYKIVFIKPPTAPPPPPPPQPPAIQADDEHTFIYVLVPSPPVTAAPTIHTTAATRVPSKPEVYFIRYKAPTNSTPSTTTTAQQLQYSQENEIPDEGRIYLPPFPTLSDRNASLSSFPTSDDDKIQSIKKGTASLLNPTIDRRDIIDNDVLPEADEPLGDNRDLSSQPNLVKRSAQSQVLCKEFHGAAEVNAELERTGLDYVEVGGGVNFEAVRRRESHLGIMCPGVGTAGRGLQGLGAPFHPPGDPIPSPSPSPTRTRRMDPGPGARDAAHARSRLTRIKFSSRYSDSWDRQLPSTIMV